METLNLSGTAPHEESRLKSLFWPSIESAGDVDYLGAQGYWVCAIVAVFLLIALSLSGYPITGIFVLLYFYLGGVGVRERSTYAAAAVLTFFLVDLVTSAIASGPSVLRVLLAAVLLSNLRATWIASRWKAGSGQAAQPPRFEETWSDKFADKLPMWLWPKIRIFYYIFSAGFLALTAVGLLVLVVQRH